MPQQSPESPDPAPAPSSDGPRRDAEDHGGGRSKWRRLHDRLHANPLTSITTKIVVTLVGVLVLSAGIVMMVTPGPGLVGIVAGLGILAIEWEWAERWLAGARRKLVEARRSAADMDPAVRRRRVLLIAGGTVLVLVVVGGYLLWRGWPRWSVSAWDKVQGLAAFVPELPGM
jgi:uncharacterized protein (TIGR02611 family)